jgi:hypothetical protein
VWSGVLVSDLREEQETEEITSVSVVVFWPFNAFFINYITQYALEIVREWLTQHQYTATTLFLTPVGFRIVVTGAEFSF